MATTIGEAVIKLSFNTKDLDKGQQEVANKVDAVLGKVGSVAKTGGKLIAAGITAAKAATASFAAVSVKAYGEYEQLEGGIQKIFNDMDYDKIAQDAQNAYKTMNISASDYMKTISGVGATFAQTMGDEKGYQTAQKGLQALADYASGTGKSVDVLMDKYQAISRSTSSYLSIADQFAGILPQTTDGFLKEAQAAGLLSGEYTRLNQVPVDEYQQALTTLMEKGVDKMGLLGNTASETTNTITGSLAAMKSSWQNLIVGITDPNADIGQLVDTLANTIDDVVANLGPAIKRALKGVSKLIEKGIPKLFEGIPKLLEQIIPELVDSGVALFNQIMTKLPELVQTVISLLSQLALAIAPQIPVILQSITQGIMDTIKTLTQPQNLQMILEVGIQLLMGLVAAIPDILVALIEALPDIIMNIVDFLTDPKNIMMIIEAAVQLFMGLVMAVPKILGKLFEAFGKLFGKLWVKCAQLFKDFAANFGEAISSVFKGAVNGVLWFLEQFINGPIDIINFFIDAINGVLSVVGGHIDKLGRIQLPRLAEGGVATSATPALIGEAGKEAVIPLERNTDNWAGLLAHTLANEFEKDNLATGGGITVYMTNNINNNLDADEIGRRLMTSIRRAA